MTPQEFKETPQGKALWEAIHNNVTKRWKKHGVVVNPRSTEMMINVADKSFGVVAPIFIKQQEACDANTESLQVVVDNMVEEVNGIKAALLKMADSKVYEGYLLVDPKDITSLLK